MKALLDKLKAQDRGIVAIVAIYLVTVALGLTPWIYSDGVGDYAWVRSAVIDGDIDCANEFAHFVAEFKVKYGWPEASNDLYPVRTSTGYQANKYAIGSSVLWTPFFLLAHGFAALSNAVLSTDYALDGYDSIYIFWVTLGSSFYALMGILLSYRLCRRFFDQNVALLAALGVWFASSIPVYMYLYPSLPHNMSLFTVALFFYHWYETRENRTPRQWAVLGMLGGLMFMTRLETAVLLVIPVLELGQDLRRQPAAWAVRGRQLGLYTLAGFLAGLPQLYVWKTVFGQWFLNPYSKMHRLVIEAKALRYGLIPDNEVLPDASSGLGSYLKFISNPDIGATLFGSAYGIFTWTPILLFAVVGFYFLYKKAPQLARYSLLALVLLIYITSCSKKTGMSFGDRYLIKAAPFFMLGLAALIERLVPLLRFRALSAAVLVLVVWNALFIVQYSAGLVNRQGAISWSEMIANQFTDAPAFFIAKAKPFLTGRSSAYKSSGTSQND